MTARSSSDIRSFYESVAGDDVLGFARDVLVLHMDYDDARPWLKPDVEESDWHPLTRDPDAVLAELREYLDFAWTKAIDHRGISASRSIDKLRALAWLAGLDAAVAEMDAAGYGPYGAPKLAALSRAVEVPIPAGDMARRMAAGEPCVPLCVECVS